MMIPPAVMASTMPAVAANFLTIAQAQQLIFPGAQLTAADITLTDAQADALARTSGTTVYRNQVKIWRVSTGGWFFVDQVPGRDDRVTYAVGLTPNGSIKAIEVMVCDPGYDQVRGPWRRHFVGKRYTRAHLSKEIPNITNSTLSVGHVIDGVTRILATYAMFIAPKQG